MLPSVSVLIKQVINSIDDKWESIANDDTNWGNINGLIEDLDSSVSLGIIDSI